MHDIQQQLQRLTHGHLLAKVNRHAGCRMRPQPMEAPGRWFCLLQAEPENAGKELP